MEDIPTNLNEITKKIIGVAIAIHKKLGPGYIEKVYQRILYLELKKIGLEFLREYKIVIKWEDAIVGYQVVDFYIANEILVEIKATSEIQDIHRYQLLSYLKAANKPLGLLLNFGSQTLTIKRVINTK